MEEAHDADAVDAELEDGEIRHSVHFMELLRVPLLWALK